jgi:uncharacterized YccA/Bax inhibitor family protein
MVVVAGFFFLSLLVAFTLADELTRNWSPRALDWSTAASVTHSPR